MKVRVVLNTRAVEQASELSRLLEEAGFLVVEAPAIAIVPAWQAADLQRVRGELAARGYSWVVIASPNAARELDLDPTQVVCGAATASALGLRPKVTLDHFSAADALAVLREHVAPGDRILVPRAAEGRDELIDGLQARGANVDAPVAYRTLAVGDAAARLGEGDIDIVTLCSPSAAGSVASAVPPRTQVVCLGATTANAARAAGLRVDAVARSTSMRALVDACLGGVRI